MDLLVQLLLLLLFVSSHVFFWLMPFCLKNILLRLAEGRWNTFSFSFCVSCLLYHSFMSKEWISRVPCLAGILYFSSSVWTSDARVSCSIRLLLRSLCQERWNFPTHHFYVFFLQQDLTIFHLFSLLRESQDLTVFNSSDYLELCILLCLGTLLLFPQNYVSIPLIFCYSLWIEVIWLFALNIVLKFWKFFFVPHLFFFSNCTVLNSLFELAIPFFHLIQSCYVCLLLFF